MILPSAHSALLALFTQHVALTPEEFRATREGVDICGQAIELDQASLIDGVMFIPVGGPLGRGLGAMEKGAGAVDYQDIIDDIDQGEDEAMCNALLLNFDSPGGGVAGCQEASNRIMACEKPIYAWVGGMCCSAAYWLACSCDQIYAGPSADVGAVGIYCYLLDTSKRMEAMGVKAEVIASGKFKGMGAPGVPLTKEQRGELQARVNARAEQFYRQVEETRGDVSREDMQGQAFTSQQALERGFIDGILDSGSDVADLLR